MSLAVRQCTCRDRGSVKNVKNVKNRLSVVWIELIPEVTRVALFGMD